MTLVIANPEDAKFNIYGDTKLTEVKRKGLEREFNEQNSIPGILKMFIINRDFCLCSAGVYSFALKTLREITNSSNKSKEELCSIIYRNHIESYEFSTSEGTDFILCSRIEKHCTLWRNGSSGFETSNTCYIGSVDAYNSIDSESSNRRSIFDLVANEDFPSIGGIVLSVYNNGTSFAYGSMLSVYFQNKTDAHPSRNFQLTTVPPTLPESRVGIFLPDKNYGYLYDPIEEDRPIKIAASDAREFQYRANLRSSS